MGLRNTPPLKPKIVNLQPSPSPPLAIPSPEVTPDSSPEPPDYSDRKRQHRRSRNWSNLGDAKLVEVMGGGKQPEITYQAGQETLTLNDDWDTDEEHRDMTTIEGVKKGTKGMCSLAAIAAGALAYKGNAAQRADGEPMDGVKPTILSSASTYAGDTRGSSSQDPSIKPGFVVSSGGLPPICQHSPQSRLPNGNGTGPITLPSLAAQLGDINHLPEPGTGDSPYPQFLPTRPNHGPPPPHRRLPSPSNPGNYYYNQNNHQRIAQADRTQYDTAAEYDSSNIETPCTDHSAPTPSLPIDRMSIDGITNPHVDGFKCAYLGCKDEPFPTQYQLNSHAKVHSSNRPHYCAVKDCPRSEGGAGFKRKNEMIRHGFIHDSLGYGCPFCPDRDHKFPRPDNLQRHVKVHHVDKDKNDQKLRDILGQRPNGHSKRRRRERPN